MRTPTLIPHPEEGRAYTPTPRPLPNIWPRRGWIARWRGVKAHRALSRQAPRVVIGFSRLTGPEIGEVRRSVLMYVLAVKEPGHACTPGCHCYISSAVQHGNSAFPNCG